MDTVLPWGMALAVFIGTLPVLGVIVWNLIEVKEIRKELVLIRERLAILEERDRAGRAIIR